MDIHFRYSKIGVSLSPPRNFSTYARKKTILSSEDRAMAAQEEGLPKRVNQASRAGVEGERILEVRGVITALK